MEERKYEEDSFQAVFEQWLAVNEEVSTAPWRTIGKLSGESTAGPILGETVAPLEITSSTLVALRYRGR